MGDWLSSLTSQLVQGLENVESQIDKALDGIPIITGTSDKSVPDETKASSVSNGGTVLHVPIRPFPGSTSTTTSVKGGGDVSNPLSKPGSSSTLAPVISAAAATASSTFFDFTSTVSKQANTAAMSSFVAADDFFSSIMIKPSGASIPSPQPSHLKVSSDFLVQQPIPSPMSHLDAMRRSDLSAATRTIQPTEKPAFRNPASPSPPVLLKSSSQAWEMEEVDLDIPSPDEAGVIQVSDLTTVDVVADTVPSEIMENSHQMKAEKISADVEEVSAIDIPMKVIVESRSHSDSPQLTEKIQAPTMLEFDSKGGDSQISIISQNAHPLPTSQVIEVSVNSGALLDEKVEEPPKELKIEHIPAASVLDSEQTSRLRKELADKDAIIQQLMEESTDISKALASNSATIKRAKQRESEIQMQTQDLTLKLEAALEEIADLQSHNSKYSTTERNMVEHMKIMSEANEQQSKQISKLERDLASSLKRQSELETSLNKAWSDLSDARKGEANTFAQSDALERQIKENEDLSLAFEVAKREAEMVDSANRKEIYDLRAALNRLRDESSWVEETLRKEITTLQARLQASESRNEAVTDVETLATRPLLRQIESLQLQYRNTMLNAEEIERSITLRLHQAEADKAQIQEKDRMLSETLNVLQSKIASLEAALSIERQEKANASVKMETDSKTIESLEVSLSELRAKLEYEKSSWSADKKSLLLNHQTVLATKISELKDELEAKHQAEIKRVQESLESLRHRQNSFASVRSNGNIAEDASPNGAVPPSPSALMSPTKTASFHSGNAPSLVIERLTINVRELQGQISSLQAQLKAANQSRNDLSDELVKLANECESYKAQMEESQRIQGQLDQLQKRYNLCLELLGEKTEEVEEMRVDIADMKRAFAEGMLSQTTQRIPTE